MNQRWNIPVRDWARDVPGVVESASKGDTLVVHSREALAFVSSFVGNSGKPLRIVLEDECVADESKSL